MHRKKQPQTFTLATCIES